MLIVKKAEHIVQHAALDIFCVHLTSILLLSLLALLITL